MSIFASGALVLGVVFLAWGTWPKPRNRRVNLPPPDPQCARFQNINDPPTRSIP